MIDYNKVLCPAIKEMKPSGIRKFFDIAQQLEGVISLGVGEPDFKTPWLLIRRYDLYKGIYRNRLFVYSFCIGGSAYSDICLCA